MKIGKYEGWDGYFIDDFDTVQCALFFAIGGYL